MRARAPELRVLVEVRPNQVSIEAVEQPVVSASPASLDLLVVDGRCKPVVDFGLPERRELLLRQIGIVRDALVEELPPSLAAPPLVVAAVTSQPVDAVRQVLGVTPVAPDGGICSKLRRSYYI
ncbi:hypothetical protein [Halomicrobium salinisoli]|uniref:hypothetical protein n=1 Tax=Halomicrobium salinisoli TaxID=2878391 RepID=UPI003B8334DD